jgi:hypothetical protein
MLPPPISFLFLYNTPTQGTALNVVGGEFEKKNKNKNTARHFATREIYI